MPKQKVLIITYYWPPAGGPGVQRWLNFVNYLPKFKIEPIVYIPENPSYPIVDESLLQQVPKNLTILKTKIWEPYKIAEKLNPKNKAYKAGKFDSKVNQSLLSKLSIYIRGNFFIPDARKFWVKPSVKFLANYIKQNNIEKIITTGPPHSLHLIGLHLKIQHPTIKWIADFRDPWTSISYHSQLKLSQSAKKKHKNLEFKVLKAADVVISTSFTDAENFKKLGAKNVTVITNGFNPKDFLEERKTTQKFTMTYAGGLELARNPTIVWESLQELCQENKTFAQNFSFNFYGNLSTGVEQSIKNNNLSNYINNKGYLSHKESIKGIINTDILLLCNFNNKKSRGIIPGKLFEYLATQNSIIGIGPSNADVELILKETQAGKYFTYTQKNELKLYIIECFSNWQYPNKQRTNNNIDQYTREALTKKLASIL